MAVADEDRMRGMRPCALVRRCRTETFVGRRSLFEGLARSMGTGPNSGDMGTMSHRLLKPLSLLFTLALFAGACSSKSGGGRVVLNGENANNHGTKAVSGGGSQEVEVDSFYFNPTLFTAKSGDKLTLTLSNDSKILHNFSVKEQNIDMDIPVGGKITVTVSVPASGTQVFFCKFHRSSGMLGALRVAT
jgi:plastocyanin